jgi:pimeloyl-ACP methyl ester carboxylesterase
MTDVVLLHGSWLGGWMWDDLAADLRERGHRVFAPTLSGEGTLSSHRDDIVSLLEEEGLTDVVIVAHSYAGMPATDVAATAPDRVTSIIYLDAYVPEEGENAFDVLPSIQPVLEGSTDESGNIAPLPAAAFNVTDPDVAASIDARLRPWPLVTHQEGSRALPDATRGVYLQLAEGRFFDDLATELEARGWPVERLPLAHLSPITDAAATAAAISRYL